VKRSISKISQKKFNILHTFLFMINLTQSRY